MANLAAVLYGKEDLRLENRPVGSPGRGEVSVSMLYCGICGSDTYYYSLGAHGTYVASEPCVMGHEASARVDQLGEGVTTLKVGDRVAIEPGNPCGSCKRCRQARHNTCLVERPWESAADGYLTRRKVLPAACCHRLPENVGDEMGAFMEPLAVAVHVCRRAGVQTGKSVLVLGAGTIGQLCMMTAMAMGVTNICITDVISARLDVAKNVGASRTYLTKSRDMSIVSADVHELMGEDPDITLECSGNEWCQVLAINTTAAGGTIVYVGVSKNEVLLPIATAAEKEIDMKSTYRYDKECYPIAIDLVSSGKLDLSPLISHRYPLEQTVEALEQACARSPGVMKVMINCQKE